MKAFLILAIIIFQNTIQAQNLAPSGGGEFVVEKSQCISHEERKAVLKEIEKNIENYNLNRTPNKSMMVLFDWPVAQNPSFDYNSTYGISNYVDHDVNYPNQLEDYNCGTQTYDTNGGYNHQGIDMFLWPFDQNQVDDDHTWAVAAADGTILAKADGHPDDNCDFTTNTNANYVILEHSDGSRTWYWHLKMNSTTSKSVGASVTKGEYLGVIASSGISTGPHLHFECYDSNLNLVDPYAGSCNGMNSNTFWNNQKPYWEPTINTAFVHHTPPSFNACPNPDTKNIASSVDRGQTYHYAVYYHDQQTTDVNSFQIKRPNGTVWNSWSFNSNFNYRASWWYWNRTIGLSEPSGNWTFEVTLNGSTFVRPFVVNGDCPPSYSSANGNALIGVQNVNNDFETDGVIESTQTVTGSSVTVYYDSGISICLDPGFEVISGAVFEALIDGCGGSQ